MNGTVILSSPQGKNGSEVSFVTADVPEIKRNEKRKRKEINQKSLTVYDSFDE